MSVKFVLVRIDDRLIHGQVAVGWVKATSPDLLMVADDTVVNNSLQKSLMEMASTPAFAVKICGVEESVVLCQQKALDGKRILMLFSSTQDVVRAIEAGLPVQEINVGGMRYGPGKRQIMKAIAINEEDIRNFNRLLNRGIKVQIQMVPTDEPVDIKRYL